MSTGNTPKFHIIDNQTKQLPQVEDTTTAEPDNINDSQQLATWVNDYFQTQLEKTKIPSAVISILFEAIKIICCISNRSIQ